MLLKNGQSRAISTIAASPNCLHALFQRAAEAVPAGQDRAALGPGEYPRDRAQILHAAHAATAGRTRTQGHPLDHVDRRGGAEIVDEVLAGRRRRDRSCDCSPTAHSSARASAPRAARPRADAARRAAPRRRSAPGCAAPARGCRTCDGSPRPARSPAARRPPNRAARTSAPARCARRRDWPSRRGHGRTPARCRPAFATSSSSTWARCRPQREASVPPSLPLSE